MSLRGMPCDKEDSEGLSSSEYTDEEELCKEESGVNFNVCVLFELLCTLK